MERFRVVYDCMYHRVCRVSEYGEIGIRGDMAIVFSVVSAQIPSSLGKIIQQSRQTILISSLVNLLSK